MTPSDLYSAIQADPAAATLAKAGDDVGCAARMAAVLPPVLGTVPANQLLIWGAKSGARAKVEARLADPAFGSICLAVRDLLGFGGTLDASAADVQDMLNALVAGGVLGTDDRASLLALAAHPQAVSVDDVSAAMSPHRPNGKVT